MYARTVQAAFWLLYRAEPGTPIRSLRDEFGQITMGHAARILLESFEAVHPSPEQRKCVVERLKENCRNKTRRIIEDAKKGGGEKVGWRKG